MRTKIGARRRALGLTGLLLPWMVAAPFLPIACGGEPDAAPNVSPGAPDAANDALQAGNTQETADSAAPDAGAEGSAASDATPDAPAPQAALADSVALREVAVFQSVKVSVEKSGKAVATSDRNAPVVAKRQALVRAYVDVGPKYKAHPLTAELSLVVGGKTLPLLTDTKTLKSSSVESDLGTTFDFEVPGESLPVGVSYSVAITDPTLPAAPRDGTASAARYPANGSVDALGAESSGDQLKVVLVPFQYQADGSGRLPDTSPAQLDLYRQTIFEAYPAAKVDLTVHAPYVWKTAINRNGDGFNDALDAIIALREDDDPTDDVYYMGIFAPGTSFGTYCSGSCVTGLSMIAKSATDASLRASVGIGFGGTAGASSAETAAHEIGHAHGLQHAPCGGVAGPDTSFPYANAVLGAWGYSFSAKTLFDPDQYHDMMSYCSPEWISDYNYGKLFDRMKFVNGADMVRAYYPQPMKYRFLRLGGDGALTWGRSMALRARPTGEEHTVTYFAADGSVLSTVTGFFYKYDHIEGGNLLVPEGPAGFARATVDGIGTVTGN